MTPTLFELIHVIDQIASRCSAIHGHEITRADLLSALLLAHPLYRECERAVEIWDMPAEADDIEAFAMSFDFASISSRIELDIDLPTQYRVDYKVRVKNCGQIWVVNQNDKDPFPSMPHAHLLDSMVKLDLATGDLYHKRTHVKSISRKNLLEIRELLQARGVQLPLLKR